MISARTARKDSGFLFKSRIIFWTKAAVAGLTLIFLVTTIRPATLMAATRIDNPEYLVAALLLLVPNLLIQVLKWRYLLSMANPSISFSSACQSLIVGYPLGFVTPGRLGEIGRAFFVPEISQFKALRLVVVDKIANLVMVVIAGLLGFSLLKAIDPHVIWTSLILLLLGSLIVTLLYVSMFDSHLTKAVGRFTRIHHFSHRNVTAVLGLSTLFVIVFLTQFSCLVLSLEEAGKLAVGEAAASAFLLKTVLPVSMGDLGVREGAAVFFLGKAGVSKAAAFNAAFLLFLVNVGIPTLIGLPVLVAAKKEVHT